MHYRSYKSVLLASEVTNNDGISYGNNFLVFESLLKCSFQNINSLIRSEQRLMFHLESQVFRQSMTL